MSPKSLANLTSNAENSEDTIYSKLVKCQPGEEIAITGISGVYPKADNVNELAEKLWSKEDLVSEVSCQEEDGLSPSKRYGKINEERIHKFDSGFFKIPMYGADAIDPQSRVLLELAYEAVMDAGYNPEQLRGTKTGVFISVYRSDSSESWIYEKNSSEGTGFYGNVRSMIGSRISFAMGLTGPVNAIDAACCSSFAALDSAIKNIHTGVCDAAIVAGCNLLLNWQVIKRWHAMGMVSPDGKCQTFSETANGYCRSEAIVALLIQKKKDARRLYAEVVHVKMNNNGDKAGAVERTSDASQIELLREFYSECRIDPTTLNYVELHGTGTKVGDVMEATALDKVFCKTNRTVPLKVGSIKSNMGHSEAVSGLCSISKAILMFEREMIPPNLHFSEPRSEITALKEGRIQVITELEPFFDNLIALNNLGYGGSNGHALLRHNIKRKINNSRPTDHLQRLVTVSGRTEKAVQKIFDELTGKPIDSEFVCLLHGIFSEDIPNHNYRGYVVLDTKGTQITKHIEKFSGEKRPIWFIFRGMGSQYPTMGRALLRLPITQESIYKSHDVLKKRGLDLIEILTKDDPKMFDNILHSFVGIAAIQIALIDLLKAIGICPDGMIGHSVGELGCAYADNCFTAEQMILAAYYRGKVSNDTNLEPGYMASVGMPHDELKSLLPHDIDIACHNAPDNYSVSGPQASIRRFSASLDRDGIFVREVNVSNIAYHSRYITPAASELLSAMKMVVPEQMQRSEKWISSSVPEANWNTLEAQNSCAEYYVNNLKNCVYFEEACRHIPNNAITIEISPHGFFQSLIKRSPNLQITNVPLLSRNSPNGVDFLFCALGRLYTLGVNPKLGLHKLYPAVPFPVGRGTPMISPLIEWNHDNNYFVTKHFLEAKKVAEQTVTVSLNSPEWEFICGHVIDGRILFPAVGYIYLAWKMFSKIEGVDFTKNSIVIENLALKRAIIISKQDKIEFTVNIQKGSGSFEILENDTIVTSGKIKKLDETAITYNDIKIIETDIADETSLPLQMTDIYKDYRLRGYQYGGQFVGVTKATYDGSTARIKWQDNYVAFLDTMIQIFLLSVDTRHLIVPTSIEKITINTRLHDEYLNRQNTKYPEFIAHYDKQLLVNKTIGVEIKRMSFNKLQRKPLGEQVTLQKIEFLPYTPTGNHSLYEALLTCSEIIKRNVNHATIQTLELVDSIDPNFALISPIFDEIWEHTPQMKVDMSVMIESNDLRLRSKIITKPNIKIKKMRLSGNEHFTLIIASNLATQTEARQFCLNAFSEGGFLLLREKNEAVADECIPSEFEICLDYKLEHERILLCRQKTKFEENIRAIRISHNSFDWIPTIQSALKEVVGYKDKRLILYADHDEFSGIVGLSYCLFKEYGTQNLRCYFITDKLAPAFSLHDSFYTSQISKDLLVNICRNGSWGTLCDSLLNKKNRILAPYAELQLEIPGDVSSLKLVEGNLDVKNIEPTPDKVLLHVYYSELNFRDVLLANAKLSSAVLSVDDNPETTRIGFGCSGKTTDGKRYMTVAKSGCFATLLNQDPDLLIPVPDDWTLEEAATVPIVYLTVIYSFFKTQRLHRGDSILIHSGTGGVGQAAIHICLYYGCNIFTTVGSPEKREFIRKTFPSIPESHIGYSRDLSFETMIMRETNGKGVDVVLNSLAEEKLLTSVKCLAVGGRFIEIGLHDFLENNPLYMNCFLKEISFHAIQLLNFFEASKSEKQRIINLMIDHLNNGAIQPLKRTIFDLTDAEAAFRYMGSGKHIGKVLLRTRPEDEDIHSPPNPLSLPAVPKFFCSNHKSYVICGGLGGLGLELIDWLILRGAKHIIISSRRGITTGYQRWKIQKWKTRGVVVIVCTDDITKIQGVRNLLDIANTLSPVGAIFNLAMILKDALFENQTETSFSECAGPKSNATIHLDQLSREMCPHLEHFVVFSSVSCGFGNLGQTNYGMANSVMERVCEKRKLENLPATAIQWGPMADVGAIVENNIEDKITLDGLTEQPVHSFLNEMNFLLRQPNAVVRSIVLNKIQSSRTNEKNVFDVLGKIFGLREMDKLDPKSKLIDFGMDSITSIEVKQIFEREFDIIASMKDIKQMTIGRIIELQNTTKINDTINTAPPKKVQRAYVKLVRHAFEILANQIPDEIKTQEWDIVLEKLPQKNGNKELSTVFVFPGFEGYSEHMKNATIHMNAYIYTIQYSSETVENFQQIVRELAEHICSILRVNENFTFIAYSFGCVIAVEVLKLLECQKKVGRLYLIDVDLIASCSIMTKLEGTDHLMNETILQFLPVYWPKFPKSLLDDVRNSPDWSSKAKSVMSQVPIDLTYARQQLGYALNLVYQRIKVIAEWEFITEQPLATLASSMRPKMNLFEENVQYDISKHFLHPVDIRDVEGNHFTMLKNVKSSDFEGTSPFDSS